MLSSSTALQDVLTLAPEWEAVLRHWENKDIGAVELFSHIGARAIYCKALSLKEEQPRFLALLRNFYYQPILSKMLGASQNLRHFLNQRHVNKEEQCHQVLSYSQELALKMEAALSKQLAQAGEDGFKVLLPAYLQRSVHNAVIDHIRQESAWERETLQDLHLDPQQEDPRSSVAEDISSSPENLALSAEQVCQLNQLRKHLSEMLVDKTLSSEPLMVVDLIFGLGLTAPAGEGVTMKECCDKLNIPGETQARRIARCQMLLDKGLDMIRQRIYTQMPDIAECWQKGVNINSASRRELTQQLGLTEGEIERLVKGRQYHNLNELVASGVLRPQRLQEITSKGAVAAFLPIEINTAVSRDIMDILGLPKETVQRLVSERPFKNLEELAKKNLLPATYDLATLKKRGAVVKVKYQDDKRIDLNRASQEDLVSCGIEQEMTKLLIQGRPYLTWTELEDFLSGETIVWPLLRQKFFLGL